MGVAAELRPGIVFPTPYLQGTAALLSCPVDAPLCSVQGSMHEAAPDRNARWHLQQSR